MNVGKYWKLMGHYNGESQTYEALAGTFAASPFLPIENAKLKGVRLIPTSEAATSLMEGFQFKMTSTSFKPNSIEFCGTGVGLRTVPANAMPVIDYPVDQPVIASNPITIEGRHSVGTAVTANVFVMGEFES